MLSTAQTFIYTALRKCGQLRPGATANPELMADALNEWSAMFDGYNAKRTLNYTTPDYIYPVPGTGSSAVNFTGTIALGSPTVLSISSSAGLAVGQSVTGTGIPANTYINSFTSTTVNLSSNATATGTFTLTASNLGPGSAALATGQVLGMGFTIGQPFVFYGNSTNGSATILTLNTVGLEINQAISGTGIPANSRILSVVPGVSVTLNKNATVTGNNGFTITADFVGPRPEAIVRANLWMTSSSPQSPTRIPLSPISAEEWANISVLQLTPINVTTVFYYEPRFPNGVLWVWPPLNGNSIEIFTWGSLTPPATLASNYQAPPGYQDLIVYELAKRLYYMCTSEQVLKRPWGVLAGEALMAKQAVMAVNAPMPRMVSDFHGGSLQTGVSDWDLLLTGTPY